MVASLSLGIPFCLPRGAGGRASFVAVLLLAHDKANEANRTDKKTISEMWRICLICLIHRKAPNRASGCEKAMTDPGPPWLV